LLRHGAVRLHDQVQFRPEGDYYTTDAFTDDAIQFVEEV
jgi:hypothetical protein